MSALLKHLSLRTYFAGCAIAWDSGRTCAAVCTPQAACDKADIASGRRAGPQRLAARGGQEPVRQLHTALVEQHQQQQPHKCVPQRKSPPLTTRKLLVPLA